MQFPGLCYYVKNSLESNIVLLLEAKSFRKGIN